MDIDRVITATWCTAWDKKYDFNFLRVLSTVSAETGAGCRCGRGGGVAGLCSTWAGLSVRFSRGWARFLCLLAKLCALVQLI